jgi:hypothetical protein
MKNTEQNPRVIVGRFLEKIGEPVSEEQSDRAVSSVLERLRAKGVSVSRFPVIAAPVLQTQSRGWSAIAAAVVVILAGGLLHILWSGPRRRISSQGPSVGRFMQWARALLS